VTSYLFPDGRFSLQRLQDLGQKVGKDRLVVDISCRKREGGWVVAMNGWKTLTDTWVNQGISPFQSLLPYPTFPTTPVVPYNSLAIHAIHHPIPPYSVYLTSHGSRFGTSHPLSRCSDCVDTWLIRTESIRLIENHCSELLIHAADVEGLCQGIDQELVERLGEWVSLPCTYAGGARGESLPKPLSVNTLDYHGPSIVNVDCRPLTSVDRRIWAKYGMGLTAL
jgi:phosphoribosylformimino-5-aminoimidazole carboxamide ribotide isomerase